MAADFRDKILDRDGLVRAVGKARAAGRTVVQCHGCFDIVHPGHIRYLEFARSQGDVLVVTLTGDPEIQKGDQRPYIPESLRAENLAALMSVDFVHIDPSPTAVDVLAAVKPDVYVKGREYEHSRDPGFLAEQRVVESGGGRIIFSSGEIVFSSSRLIEQIPRSREFETHRLNLLCQRQHITRTVVRDLLDGMRDQRVLIVGDVVLDRYVFCDAIGVASESPMMSLSQLDEQEYIGGAAIVARHAAALGARPTLLSAGDGGERSQRVAADLQREGVETELLPVRPDIIEKTRFLVDDDKLLKVDRAHRHPLDSIAERRAARIMEGRSREVDAVIFCDFGYGMITGPLLSRTLPTLRQNVRVLSADVSGGRANLLSFANMDLLCPTERELRAALNDYDSGLSAVAYDVLHKTQARHIMVTLEKRGMVAFERRSQDRATPEWSGRLKSEAVPSLADSVIDRLGCGDALLCAATLSLAAGATLHQAAYIGSAAAAIELAMLGNRPVTCDAMQRWFKSRPELLQEVREQAAMSREQVPIAPPSESGVLSGVRDNNGGGSGRELAAPSQPRRGV